MTTIRKNILFRRVTFQHSGVLSIESLIPENMRPELSDALWEDTASNSKIVFRRTASKKFYIIDYYEGDQMVISGIYVLVLPFGDSNTWLLEGNTEKFGKISFTSPDEIQLTLFNTNSQQSAKTLYCQRKPLEQKIYSHDVK
jgi:hypothetical protein